MPLEMAQRLHTLAGSVSKAGELTVTMPEIVTRPN